MMDCILNLYYKIRFSLLNNTEARDTYPDMELVKDYRFTGNLFGFFNKYFAELNEGGNTCLPKLSCIEQDENGTTLIGRVNKDPETNELYPFETAFLSSKGTFAQLYGKFELTCKVPEHEGMFWAAFWFYGNTWPPEVDVFEFMAKKFNKNKATKHLTTTGHWLDAKGLHQQKGRRVRSRQDLSKDFHKYGLLWTPKKMVWYVDDIAIYQLSGRSPDVPMHIVINTATGSGVEEMGDKVGRFVLRSLRIHKL